MQYSRVTSSAAPERRTCAESSSDRSLIASTAKHDEGALRVLFARHNVRVFRFLMRMVGNRAMAEDLVSEVFLEVWRSAGRFEGRSQVATWILGIARHKALAALRRRSDEALGDDAAQLIEDPADNPEVALEKQDCDALLRRSLKQLSPAHREIIDLVYYHRQSIDEAARVAGVPPNTVKTRMFYARRHLAQLMAASGIEQAWR